MNITIKIYNKGEPNGIWLILNGVVKVKQAYLKKKEAIYRSYGNEVLGEFPRCSTFKHDLITAKH